MKKGEAFHLQRLPGKWKGPTPGTTGCLEHAVNDDFCSGCPRTPAARSVSLRKSPLVGSQADFSSPFLYTQKCYIWQAVGCQVTFYRWRPMESAPPNVHFEGTFLPGVKILLLDLIHKNHKTRRDLGHHLSPPLTLEETEAQRGQLP